MVRLAHSAYSQIDQGYCNCEEATLQNIQTTKLLNIYVFVASLINNHMR